MSPTPVGAARRYTFRLDAAEVERFQAMAANAVRHEQRLWTLAGIAPGATVVDLGCGPGALLPLLAQRVGPDGTIIAVDADPVACETAHHVAAGLGANVRVVQADAAHTGIEPGVADVLMCRNMLVHNGARAKELLDHASQLLHVDGHLLSAEPDVEGIDFGAAHAEREYERRWAAMVAADGNDPALGAGDRLPHLLRRCGWRIRDSLIWTDRLAIDRSPAWAAADAVISRGFATVAEVGSWQGAMEERRAAGPLHCALTMTTVVAAPGHRDGGRAGREGGH